jgi:hypothetical protein
VLCSIPVELVPFASPFYPLLIYPLYPNSRRSLVASECLLGPKADIEQQMEVLVMPTTKWRENKERP